jgi:5'-3' exonuclease
MYLSGYRQDPLVDNDSAAEEIAERAAVYMRAWYRTFSPNHFVFACDSGTYWRREFFPEYKAHREEDTLKKLVRRAIKFYKNKHANKCLELEGCEADDVIYALTKHLPGHKVIISSDKDFEQLMSDQVWLFDPKTQTYRRPSKNIAFDLFLKCIRGDRGDNIPSAYPRVLTNKLKLIFECPKERQKMFEQPHPQGGKISEYFSRNQKLIDLSYLPTELEEILKIKIPELIELFY